MGSLSNIQYLPHGRIDKKKWDDCINRASNGLIYGYSFYLDHMSQHWDALVLDDYEAVMPLTWNRKYGTHYLYQPFLTAQLGVFGSAVNTALIEAFLKSVPTKFRYWDVYLNHKNLVSVEDFDLYQRVNYILKLDKPYTELYDGYRENIQRNTRKALQAGCIVEKDFDVSKVIELAWRQMRQHSRESGENAERFRKLYHYLYSQQMATTYGISLKGELLASCVFFFSHNRAYYILVGNHPNGKTIGASHALIDAFIKDNAGKNMLLDFEGSDIRNLAFFYSSFGAVEEKYAGLKLNKLPFYLKWFKK